MGMNADIRADFEAQVKAWKHYDDSRFQRDDRGQYVDKKIRSMWQGYCLYQRKFDSHFVESSPEDRSNGVGLYVIGKVNKNNVITFAQRPFRHKHMQVAMHEADRLVDRHQSAFGVFRCLRVHTPKIETSEVEK